MRTGVIFDHGLSSVTPHFNFQTKQAVSASLLGYDFVIDKTWDGRPIDHEPIYIHMEWSFERIPGRPHKRVVKVHFSAPLFDDPEGPDELPGVCPGLWNYEVVEFFFANGKNQYLEVEVGPHGHWLCLLFDGVRKPFNNGEELELSVQNTIEGTTWRCTLEIPLAYLPAGCHKFNAYAIHGSEPDRVYEALNPVTDGSHTEPDFHRLEYFQKIELRRIVPEGYNESAFNDLKYGDMWEGR